MFLSREQMWDLPLGGSKAKTERHITHWCGNIFYVLFGIMAKVGFRFSVIGRDHLRAFKDAGEGVVVISNHSSYLDVVFLYLSARLKQWIRFMARDTLFDTGGGLGGQIFARVGAFPVKRDSADRASIRRATHMLRDGEVVGIFPEGTRRGKGSSKLELHAGASLIAKMGHAAILPCALVNVGSIKKKGGRIHFNHVKAIYGTPFEFSSFSFVPKEDRLEACTWYAMRECFALVQDLPASQVDMKALFPDTKDYREVFCGHTISPYVPKQNAAKTKGME